MEDESKLRERVQQDKEAKAKREQDKKKRAIENAKRAALTSEQ